MKFPLCHDPRQSAYEPLWKKAINVLFILLLPTLAFSQSTEEIPPIQITIAKERLLEKSQKIFSKIMKKGIEDSLQKLNLEKLNYYPTDPRCQNREAFAELELTEKFQLCQALPNTFTYGLKLKEPYTFTYGLKLKEPLLEPTSLKVKKLAFRDFDFKEDISLKKVAPEKYQVKTCLNKATVFGDFAWQSLISGEMIYYDPYLRMDFDSAQDGELCFQFFASFDEVDGSFKLNIEQGDLKLITSEDFKLRKFMLVFAQDDTSTFNEDIIKLHPENLEDKKQQEIFLFCTSFFQFYDFGENVDMMVDVSKTIERVLFKHIPFDPSVYHARVELYNTFQEKKGWPSKLSDKEKALFMMDKDLSEEDINSQIFQKTSENFAKRILEKERIANLFYFRLIHAIGKKNKEKVKESLTQELNKLPNSLDDSPHKETIKEESYKFLQDLANKKFQFYQKRMGPLDKDLTTREERLITTFHDTWTNVNSISQLQPIILTGITRNALEKVLPYALSNITLNKKVSDKKQKIMCKSIKKFESMQTRLDSARLIEAITDTKTAIDKIKSHNQHIARPNTGIQNNPSSHLKDIIRIAKHIKTNDSKDAFLDFEKFLTEKNIENTCKDCQESLEEIKKIKEQINIEAPTSSHKFCVNSISESDGKINLFVTEERVENKENAIAYSDPSCIYDNKYDKKLFISFDYLKKYLKEYVFDEDILCIRKSFSDNPQNCDGYLAKITEKITIGKKSPEEMLLEFNMDLQKSNNMLPVFGNLLDIKRTGSCNFKTTVSSSFINEQINFNLDTESDCTTNASNLFVKLVISIVNPYFLVALVVSNLENLVEDSYKNEDDFLVDVQNIKHFCVGEKGLSLYLDF